MISKHLKPYSCFIPCDRSHKDGKKPLDRSGDFNDNLISYEKANQCLEQGHNIGFVAGHGTLLLDCDDVELYQAVKQLLPETYEEKTTSEGYHFIFSCDFIAENREIKRNGKHLGELRGNRQYILISPSVAKSKIDGKFKGYEIINDIPLAKITEKQLDEFLYLFPKENNLLQDHKTTVGVKKEGVDRSRYDFAKCCELIEAGFDNFSDINNKMLVVGSEKWKGRFDNYRKATYFAAMRRVKR